MNKPLRDIGTGERGTFYHNPKTGKLTRKPEKKKKRVHNVIGDTLPEPVESMATAGREKFDSKSKLNRHLKAHGFRVSGAAPNTIPRMSELREMEEREERERREDTEAAFYDVKYDRVEFSEQEKENHRREERACRANGLPTKLKAPH